MPETNQLSVMQCPKCGAPVEMVADEVKCSYCGTKLKHQHPQVQERVVERIVVQQAPAYEAPRYAPSRYVAPRRRGSALGSLFSVMLTTLIIGTVLYYIALSEGDISAITGKAFELPPYVYKNAVLLPRAEDAAQNFVVRATDLNASKTYVTAVDGATLSTLWKGPLLNKDTATQTPLLSANGFVYVVDQTTLMALDATSGAVTWQVSLATGLPVSCRPACLALYGHDVVALNKDGTLQSFDAESGKPAWSKRLNTTPPGILDAAGRVVVMDQTQQGGGDNVVLVIDPASGAVQKLTPACSIDNIRMTLATSDNMAVTSDGKALITVYSWSSLCIQRWDIASNKQVWSTIVSTQQMSVFFVTSENRLMTADAMFLTGDSGRTGWVASVDMKNGKVQRFDEDKRYKLTFQGVSAGILIVSAVPDYDNQTTELWGLDVATGERQWQYVLRTKGILPSWLTHLGIGGLAVVQCVRDEKTCSLDVLDVHTGVGSETLTLPRTQPYGNLDGASWSGNLGYITISGQVHVVDTASLAQHSVWP